MGTDTALLIIDMQRDFLDPDGYIARSGVDVSPLRAIIPEVQRLLMAARRIGVRVVHTREGHRPDLSDLSAVKQRRAAGCGAAIGSVGPLGRLLVRGEPGHAIVDDLAPVPGESIIDKPGFGAFYATDLELILRAAGDPAIHAAMLACIAGEGGILGEVLSTQEVLSNWMLRRPARGAVPCTDC
jgi:nicotinamidase-related amidase